jgi:hypothetical protein
MRFVFVPTSVVRSADPWPAVRGSDDLKTAMIRDLSPAFSAAVVRCTSQAARCRRPSTKRATNEQTTAPESQNSLSDEPVR